MANFIDMISAGFGAPVDRAGAYDTGRLRSAQTESALAQARERRAAAVIKEREDAARESIHQNPGIFSGPRDAMLAATLEGGYGNLDQVTQGGLNLQQYDNRDILADPNAPLVDQFSAGQGVQGKVLPRFDPVGEGSFADLLHPELGVTPTQLAKDKLAAGGTDSNAVKNYKFSQSLPGAPAPSVGAFQPFVRNEQVVGTPGGPVNMGFGGQSAATPVVDPAVAAQRAAELEAARAGGRATGQKQAALETSLNSFSEIRTAVNNLLTHPGFNTIYGKSGIGGLAAMVPGTDAAGAASIRSQLTSKSFLASIQQMRGLGQLSNAEGLKTETALQRATTPGLKDDEARLAFAELLTSLAALERTARAEASATPSALTTPNQNSGMPGAAGVLSPEEEAELAALRAELGGG